MGILLALPEDMVKRLDDLIAYQQAKAFKLEVYSIVRVHPAAIRFYRYALGSLEEAQVRLLDGVARGFFARTECSDALRHAKRSSSATVALIKSLEP